MKYLMGIIGVVVFLNFLCPFRNVTGINLPAIKMTSAALAAPHILEPNVPKNQFLIKLLQRQGLPLNIRELRVRPGEFIGGVAGALPTKSRFVERMIPSDDLKQPLPTLEELIEQLGGTPSEFGQLISPALRAEGNAVKAQARAIIIELLEERQRQAKMPSEHYLSSLYPELFQPGKQVAGPLLLGQPREVVTDQISINDPRLLLIKPREKGRYKKYR